MECAVNSKVAKLHANKYYRRIICSSFSIFLDCSEAWLMQLKMVILKRSAHSLLSHIYTLFQTPIYCPKRKIQHRFRKRAIKWPRIIFVSKTYDSHMYVWSTHTEDALVVLKITTKNYGGKIQVEHHNRWLWFGHPGFPNSLVTEIKIHQLWYLSKSYANDEAWKP